MIVICQNDFPIGVLPGATEEQAEAFIKKMRADSDAAITDPRQVRPVFHWHDVPEMKAGDWSCPPCTSTTAPLQDEIETLLADLDRRDSIIATHAADTREYQKRISQAEARAERLAEALRNSADALERLAFAIRAPNAHTPQLVELAIAMRAAALRDQEEGHEHLP